MTEALKALEYLKFLYDFSSDYAKAVKDKKLKKDAIKCIDFAYGKVRAALGQTGGGDDCTMCKGTGGVQEYFENILESSDQCPKCNGTGETPPAEQASGVEEAIDWELIKDAVCYAPIRLGHMEGREVVRAKQALSRQSLRVDVEGLKLLCGHERQKQGKTYSPEYHDGWNDCIDHLAQTGQISAWRPTHKHKKTNGEYMVVGPALMQCENNPLDEAEVLIYRAFSGMMFARPVKEFYDGRFEELPTPPEEGEA